MRKFRKIAITVIPALVLCAAPVTFHKVSADTGVFDNFYTWTIENDMLTISALDGSYTVTSEGDLITISGSSCSLNISGDASQDDVPAPVLNYLMTHPASRYIIDVEEIDGLVSFFPMNETHVVLTEKVRLAGENSLAMVPEGSVVTVRNAELSLDGSGLGCLNNTAQNMFIRGYAGSPTEGYAAQEEGFTFVPLECSGTLDAEGLYTWEIKDDILTVSANDGSCQIEYLPDEILVTGISYQMLDCWNDLHPEEPEGLALFCFLEDYAPERWSFDVETIDSYYLPYRYQNVKEISLSDRVQSICQGGLAVCEGLTDVFVSAKALDLHDSLLGCNTQGEAVNQNLTIHGYADSPAQAYAEEMGFSFVAFEIPEETAPPETEPETTMLPETVPPASETDASPENAMPSESEAFPEELLPEEMETIESTTSKSVPRLPTRPSSATETATPKSNLPSTPTVTYQYTAETKPEKDISLLNMPDTGEKGFIALTISGMTAMLGLLLTRRKK